MTDLARMLLPGLPVILVAFLIAGFSGVGTYGWLPLLPASLAALALAVVWARRSSRRRRPEIAYAAAVLFGEAMMAVAIVIATGPRGYAMALMAMPVLLGAVLFPRRVVFAMTGISMVLVAALLLAVDWPELSRTPPIMLSSLGVVLILAMTALLVRDMEEAARRSAFADELTGALNRSALTPRLAELRHQTAATGDTVAVLVADLDRFKEINDRHGHAAGDAVLRAVARRLSSCVGAFEPVYRLGGEEFLIILPGREEAAAAGIASRMREAVRRTPVRGVTVTISIGVACSPAGRPFDFDEVFARADRALYAAKEGGRDRVFEAGMAPDDDRAVALAAEHAARRHRGRRLRAVEPEETIPTAGWTEGAPTASTRTALPVTTELRREHILDLNRRLSPLFRAWAVVIFVMIAASAPWFGLKVLIAPLCVAIPYYFLTRHAERFRRPALALALGWACLQTSIALGFMEAHEAPLFAIPLLVLMVPGRCAVFTRWQAVAGTVYTGVLIILVGLSLDSAAVLANPSTVLFAVALLVEAGYVGVIVGGSAIGLRGAGIVDELTGLLSRTALNARLLELEAAAGGRGTTALLLTDLDNFKEINDSAGHSAGDAVLCDTAARIRSCLRAFESAYRVGGEEFLILLPDTTEDAAVAVAERLRATLSTSPCAGVPVTMSVGVATTAPGERFNFSAVFARADAALYEAKRAGRDRVCIAAPVAPSGQVRSIGAVGPAA
jgi:diguanylate cyclase (GGDEF)-like protein